MDGTTLRDLLLAGLAWLDRHHEIVNALVTQSSDKEFHCLTITLFYKVN